VRSSDLDRLVASAGLSPPCRAERARFERELRVTIRRVQRLASLDLGGAAPTGAAEASGVPPRPPLRDDLGPSASDGDPTESGIPTGALLDLPAPP